MSEPVKFDKIEDAIEAYVNVRNELRLHMKTAKTKEDELKFFLEQVSMWLLNQADKLGVDQFKSAKYGTAYRKTSKTFRVGNWDDFISWVAETQNFQCLEKRVAKRAAMEIFATDGEVPPGLNYIEEIEFAVLSPGKKVGDDNE
jgi:hypothetical protein